MIVTAICKRSKIKYSAVPIQRQENVITFSVQIKDSGKYVRMAGDGPIIICEPSIRFIYSFIYYLSLDA